MPLPLCVEYWVDRKRTTKGWCALKPGAKPDPKASSDQTACDYFVSLRIGLEQREPTCVECRKALGLP